MSQVVTDGKTSMADSLAERGAELRLRGPVWLARSRTVLYPLRVMRCVSTGCTMSPGAGMTWAARPGPDRPLLTQRGECLWTKSMMSTSSGRSIGS